MRHVNRAALVLGLGIGGSLGGIVVHQFLGRHQPQSGWYPMDGVPLMMIGNGLFHLLCLLLVLVGIAMLDRQES